MVECQFSDEVQALYPRRSFNVIRIVFFEKTSSSLYKSQRLDTLYDKRFNKCSEIATVFSIGELKIGIVLSTFSKENNISFIIIKQLTMLVWICLIRNIYIFFKDYRIPSSTVAPAVLTKVDPKVNREANLSEIFILSFANLKLFSK